MLGQQARGASGGWPDQSIGLGALRPSGLLRVARSDAEPLRAIDFLERPGCSALTFSAAVLAIERVVRLVLQPNEVALCRQDRHGGIRT
jgi:hypothetical protein